MHMSLWIINDVQDPGEIEDKLKEIEDMLLCPVCFEVYDAEDLRRAYVWVFLQPMSGLPWKAVIASIVVIHYAIVA